MINDKEMKEMEEITSPGVTSMTELFSIFKITIIVDILSVVFLVTIFFTAVFNLFVFTVKGGECDSLNQVSSKLCTECIKQNRDMIVGVKVRLSASAANDGANEEEAFRFVNVFIFVPVSVLKMNYVIMKISQGARKCSVILC